MSHNIVYVYNDEGVGVESLRQTIAMLKRYAQDPLQEENFDLTVIKTIDATGVRDGQWANDAVLFIMPGGADLPYTKKLNGVGNQRIKDFVTGGGSYLGICAGAYYAASFVVFDKGGPLEVVGPRELAFFQGKAIGPILAPYNYEDYRGSRAAVLQCFLSEKTPPDEPVTKDIALFLTTVFYNGGGYFEDAALMPPTQILATYENNLPAIIQCSYGQGTVVLSGVHFDYDPALMNAQDPHLKEIIPQLQGHHETTKRLINKIFLTLGFFEA